MTGTDKWSAVKDGDVEAGIFISLIAGGAIALFAPVTLETPTVATRLPKVKTTATANNKRVIGIAVGGSGKVENGNAADGDGDIVQVQIFGLAKCVVDGGAATIAIGDLLMTTSKAGKAQKVTSNPATYTAATINKYVFAKAMFGSDTDGDTIVVYLTGGSGL